MEKFNEGMTLVQFCSGKLDEAKSQVELLLEQGRQTGEQYPFAEEDGGDHDLSE